MRTIFLTEDYDLEIRELPVPQMGPMDAMVRVHSGGVCGTDVSTYTNTHFLRRAPQILGHEVSGELVAVGSRVHGWEPGERVFVNPVVICGKCRECASGHLTRCSNLKLPGLQLAGLFSDLIVMPATQLHRLPDGLSWLQGALIEPTSVAHHAVGRAQLRSGASVAVLGAGPIGSLAALICDQLHDARLLVADLKQSNLDLLQGIIGCTVVNPGSESIAEAQKRMTGGDGLDVVLVANHAEQSLVDAVSLLRPGGRIVAIAAAYEPLPRVNVPRIVWHELELRGTFGFDADDVTSVIDLIEAGLRVQEIVTDRHPPEEAPVVFAEIARGEGEHVKTMFDFA
jgi:L-iditol 2-dehydrogenase